MNENADALRAMLRQMGMESRITTLDAALAAARAEALEEATTALERRNPGPNSSWEEAKRIIRALITTPAPASIPVEKVREVIGPRLEHARSEGHGWVRKELQAVAEALGVTCDCTRPLGHDNAPDCGVPIDGGQGAEVHAGREFVRSMGVNPDAVDPLCECGEVLSAHRRGGRRGIDETDPPYRTLCVGFRTKVAP